MYKRKKGPLENANGVCVCACVYITNVCLLSYYIYIILYANMYVHSYTKEYKYTYCIPEA